MFPRLIYNTILYIICLIDHANISCEMIPGCLHLASLSLLMYLFPPFIWYWIFLWTSRQDMYWAWFCWSGLELDSTFFPLFYENLRHILYSFAITASSVTFSENRQLTCSVAVLIGTDLMCVLSLTNTWLSDWLATFFTFILIGPCSSRLYLKKILNTSQYCRKNYSIILIGGRYSNLQSDWSIICILCNLVPEM